MRTEFFQCRDFTLDLGSRTHIMGIVNVTPDSFSDDGEFFDKEKAVAHALELEAEGADIIDIGAESTRPGSVAVSEQEQLERIEGIVGKLAKVLKVPISIDTTSAFVARKCLDVGASIINDISALTNDDSLGPIVAEYRAGIVLMHMQGTPETMQKEPIYADVMQQIKQFLTGAKERAINFGIDIDRIMIDPGIGFGKTTEHNLQIIKFLDRLKELELPLLIGTSRKSFIGNILNLPAKDREWGTAASIVYSIINGAQVVRVHKVKQMKQVVDLTDAIKRQ